MRILYECDKQACEKCDPIGECKLTSDIYHAKNFDILTERCSNGELRDVGAVEKIRKKTIIISTEVLYKPEVLQKLQNTITKEYEETGFIFLPPGWSYKEIDSEVNIEFDIKEET